MTFPDYAGLFKTGAMKCAETLGGLASQMHMPEEALAATVSEVMALKKGGGAARGLSGAHVWGYLSGNGLLSAVALGRIAAVEIARKRQTGL